MLAHRRRRLHNNGTIVFGLPCFNHCADELFASIFHSFEAGIAHAISSFK